MIERYCYFDVDAFLGDYYKNERLLKELNIKRNAIADSGGIDYESIKGTTIGDPTARKVEKMIRIDRKIEQLKDYFQLYDRIAASMDGEEMKILIYLQTPPNSRSIQKLANALGYSRTSAYRKMVGVRKKVRQIADYEA